MKEETYYKTCNECRVEKIMTEFSVNQYGKNNRILRRPVCIECYSKKKKIKILLKKEPTMNLDFVDRLIII